MNKSYLSNNSNSFILTNLLKKTKKSLSEDLTEKIKAQIEQDERIKEDIERDQDPQFIKEKELTEKAEKEKFANYISSFVSINMINDLNFKQSLATNSMALNEHDFGKNLGSMLSIREENEDGQHWNNMVKNKVNIIKKKNLFKDSTPRDSKLKQSEGKDEIL